MKNFYSIRTKVCIVLCITGLLSILFLGNGSSFAKNTELSEVSQTGAIVADHTVVRHVMDDLIPESAINNTKDSLHIAYQHTSHGSQITSGMSGLPAFKVSKGGKEGLYDWTESPSEGEALDLDDYAMGSYADSASDVGYADWAEATKNYLEVHTDVNVVIWSWCGQVNNFDEQGLIDHYLAPMTSLENNFTDVDFVYMTGHVEGDGLEGTVHRSNEQIRNYTRDNGKILFDFADIESYDPDGNYFGDKYVNDDCSYLVDGARTGNWALEWQAANPDGYYNCSSAHSIALNANMKAYAAWWLWARLAGWEDPSSSSTSGSSSTGISGIPETSGEPLSTGFAFTVVMGTMMASMVVLKVKRKN